MKVYIGTNKMSDKSQHGLTVYSSDGEVLHSSIIHEGTSDNKFESPLNGLMWAIKKVRVLLQNKVIQPLEGEGIVIIIGSKTLYGWLKKEYAPEPYTLKLSDIILELSFYTVDVEIIQSDTLKRVLYRNSEIEEVVKATELFS